MSAELRIFPIETVPEVRPGDDLAGDGVSCGKRGLAVSTRVPWPEEKFMSLTDLHTTTALPQLVSEGLTYRDRDGSTVEYAHLDHGATTPAFVAVTMRDSPTTASTARSSPDGVT